VVGKDYALMLRIFPSSESLTNCVHGTAMQLHFELSKTRRKDSDGRSDRSLVPAAATDIGLERSVNEDKFATICTTTGECFVVLDGMGGAEGGEFAAQISVDAMRRALSGNLEGDVVETLKGSIEEANRTIVLRRQSKRFKEMGTTVVAALIEDSSVAISHVGDSRAYLVREQAIEQLTVDHTFVQHLVDLNQISRDEALPHPQSHILTQCLGSSPDLIVEVGRYWIWPLRKGEATDYLVLCTDGLYSMVSDEEIFTIVTSLPPHEACAELIKLANGRGGFDNITVSIVPLHGHLREEESPTSERERMNRARSVRKERWWRRSFVYHLIVASLFGCGLAFAGVGVFLFFRIFGES
jgi:serine/threonine protein phosphatase PrpC